MTSHSLAQTATCPVTVRFGLTNSLITCMEILTLNVFNSSDFDELCDADFDHTSLASPPGLHFPPCRTSVACVDQESVLVGGDVTAGRFRLPAQPQSGHWPLEHNDQMPPGLHFPPCRTRSSCVDRMPAVLHFSHARPLSDVVHSDDAEAPCVDRMPPLLHFPPCHIRVSCVDRMPAVLRFSHARPLSDFVRSDDAEASCVDRMPLVLHFPHARPLSDVVRSDDAEGRPAFDSKSSAGERFVLLSDFAGIDVPGFGLRALGVAHDHFAFEIDPVARRFITDNFPDVRLFGSVCDRSPSVASGADIVSAGFPCQPYSLLGLQEGWKDRKGRGDLVMATIDYVLRERPRIVLLENVAAFARSDQGRALGWIVDALTNGQRYTVAHRIICTSEHGLPQTRRRWFLVALRSDCVVHEFVWPEPIQMMPLSLVLGPRAADDSPERRPGDIGSLASRNVDIDWLDAHGKDILAADYIVDCNASEKWCGRPTERCPCLTRSCPQGLWNVSRGCRLSPAATLRLQGVCASDLVLPSNDGHVRNLAGNAMSLCVLSDCCGAPCLRLEYASPDSPTDGQAASRKLS